jgi:Mrp family chromosome partitioning ATPase
MPESQRLRGLVQEFSSEYDLVVIDTSPTGVVADAIPLMRQTDGVIVVTDMSRSNRSDARRFAQELRRLGVPLLGIVANRVRTKAARYGDYYGYGDSPDTAGEQVGSSQS